MQPHVDEYLLPMAERNAYRIIPLGLFLGSPTPEHYRPLADGLTYRYFHPVRKQSWWQGANCHLAAAVAAGSQDAGRPEAAVDAGGF